jgi:hypothetical protein
VAEALQVGGGGGGVGGSEGGGAFGRGWLRGEALFDEGAWVAEAPQEGGGGRRGRTVPKQPCMAYGAQRTRGQDPIQLCPRLRSLPPRSPPPTAVAHLPSPRPPRRRQGLAQLEADLPEAYDYVAPCFPPGYNVFDSLFQMYHVQVGGGGWGEAGLICGAVTQPGGTRRRRRPESGAAPQGRAPPSRPPPESPFMLLIWRPAPAPAPDRDRDRRGRAVVGGAHHQEPARHHGLGARRSGGLRAGCPAAADGLRSSRHPLMLRASKQP